MLVPTVFPMGALTAHKYICIIGCVSPGVMLTCDSQGLRKAL